MAATTGNLARLITAAGGQVEGRFVTKPGVMVISKTEVTPAAKELFTAMHCDVNAPDYLMEGEFNARLTYMNFPAESKDASGMHTKLIDELKHLSCYADTSVTFLVAGCAIETVLEFVSHHEAHCSRLTSSKTKAMNETLYRVQGEQKAATEAFIAARGGISTEGLDMELTNMINLGTRAGAFTFNMNIKDFHKLFIGRFPSGNELEVREICAEMCRQLHALYPRFILAPETYAAMGNGAKLFVE